MRSAPIAVALLASLAACSNDRTLCPQDGPRPAISATLYDRAADTIIVGGNVRGEIRDGAYRDSLYVMGRNADWEPVGYVAGVGRPGVYVVTVERDGFRPAERRNVAVPDGGTCGVLTVYVRIDMDPE